MRLIDKDALLSDIERTIGESGCVNHESDIMDCIRYASEVDAVPVVRGEWKLYGNDDDLGMSYWCTACNFQLSEDLFYSGYKNGRWVENGVFNYCPNCGAKMDGERKNNA